GITVTELAPALVSLSMDKQFLQQFSELSGISVDTVVSVRGQKFRDGAAGKGVPLQAAQAIFRKFNGEYMFPEAHAFAFGVTAYQASWLKRFYPL
ncbi:MAG: hypothetical protein AAB289_06130, partial [Chloroflexota bacterium]